MIFIYLESVEPLRVSWLLLDEQDKVQQTIIHGDLSTLTPQQKTNVTLIVPAENVLLTSAQLPSLSRHRLMQALPYALEESLIEEVNELHFAIAKQSSDGNVPAAVVTKEKMQTWLAIFYEFEIYPSKMYSALFTVPFAEKNWDVIINHHSCLTRSNDFEGFACDKENIIALLELKITTTINKPETIHIHSTESLTLPDVIQTIPIHRKTLTEENLLRHMLVWLNTHPNINLLQGTYQPKRKSAKTKKLWLTTCSLLLAWVVLMFVNEFVSYIILNKHAKQLDTAISKIYYEVFPHATALVAPRERMTNRLNKLSGQTNNNYFLSLLAETGSVLVQQKSLRLLHFDFRDNRLTLAVTAPNFETLDTTMQALTQRGLSVKQQNASEENNMVNAILLIQRGHA